jgi:polyribonucleotide nucleotidyltransferase
MREADFIAALQFGQESIQPLIAAQKELAAKLGKTKRQINVSVVPDDILKAAREAIGSGFSPPC